MKIDIYVKRILAFGFYLLCGGILFAILLLSMNSLFFIHWHWLLLLTATCFTTLVLGTHFLCSSLDQIEDRVHCAGLVFRFMFVIYIFLIIYILFVFNYRVIVSAYNTIDTRKLFFKGKSNFIPFATVFQYGVGVFYNTVKTLHVVRNTIGNLLLFIPMGLFLPCIFKKYDKTNYFIITILIIRILFEIMQVLFRVGVFDVDDILLSLLGAMIGYKVYHLKFFQSFIKKLYLVES